MVQPIDYYGRIAQPDIGQSVLGGLQVGQALRAQEAQQAQAQQYSADLQAYLANPSAQGAAAMSAKYPDQRKAFAQAWEIQSKDQQDSQFRAGTEVYSAVQSGRPDVAAQILDENIAALENSGQDPSSLKAIRAQLQRDPKSTAATIGLTLSALDPEKWSKIATEQRAAQEAPFDLTEKQAKAQKAAVDAKFAEAEAVQDLAKTGWDITKIQNDIGISRQNSQIAAMNAQISRETNDLKRSELQQKIQDAQVKRNDTVRAKTAEVESGRSTIDNFLNTADQALQTPAGVVADAAGTISSRLPTIDQDVADFEEVLKTLSSQAFLSQVPAMKGLGALTEAEGKKLESSLANLSLRQSPEKLMSNVKEAQRLMLKARATLSDKHGIPDITPDTPAVAPGAGEIDALLQKYGG